MDIPTNTPLRHIPDDYCPPGSAAWFTLGEGLDAGKRLFYYDYVCGQGEPEATVLMVHGNPESSYTYRSIRDALIASGRCLRLVAVDHIGFGLSDQADFEMVDMHHAANLQQVVSFLDLRQVSLVVHDWGGPIGIAALLEEHWRVASVVVLNTTVFPMPRAGLRYTNFPAPWLNWASIPRLIPHWLWGGVAGYVVSHASPQSTMRFLFNCCRYMAAYGLRRLQVASPEYVWSEALRSPANARSSMRNVRQTPVWGWGYRYVDARHGVQDNHAFYRRIQAQLPRRWANLPAAGFFGRWDPCGKQEVVAQWHRALPRMAQATWCFDDCGHFIEEVKGVEIAEQILALGSGS